MDPLYTQALKIAENRAATPAAIAAVAKETSGEAARWAFTQWSLRQKARAKFDRADEMLFDREGLEMATHEQVAAYHASLFPVGVPVVDLTAGLGADLIALAKRGPTTGYELDPERADLLRHNLKIHGLEAGIRNEDSREAYDQYVLLDPARRAGGKRTLDPAEFQPNPALIAEQRKDVQLGVIKLSPMLPDSFLESLGPRLEFVSFGGECREALVIFGQEAQPGRFAVHLESDQTLEATAQDPPQTETPSQYLFEADPAAIRAHTLGQFVLFDLYALGDSNGYLTGNQPQDNPWLKQYRVLKTIKADLKQARQELEKLGSKTPIIKQRGANQDIESLRKQLRLKGSKELCLILYPVGKSVRYVIAE